MKIDKRETQVVASGQCIRVDKDAALDVAEDESRPPAGPIKPGKITFAGKLAGYFRREYVFLTANSDITLEQLYQKLLLVDAEEKRARAKFREMMFVMASDLREARKSSLAGSPAGLARPMSEWRERYSELDRYRSR